MKLDEITKHVELQRKNKDNTGDIQLEAYLQRSGIDIKNIYQEFEMTSHYIDMHRDVSLGTDSIQLHSHSFYEIIYCSSNSGVEYLVGTSRYRLQRGDIVFVPPGIGHRPLLAINLIEPYHRDVIWMSMEFVKRLSEFIPDIGIHMKKWQGLIRITDSYAGKLAEAFHKGVKETEKKQPGWQAVVYGNAFQLMTFLDRVMQNNKTVYLGEQPELLDDIMDYIEQNLSGKITLSETAKRFWVSESTISQTFRKKMNVSFYHCVTQRRLIAAKVLILEGVVLEEVGERVGFGDYSTFYRAFKQEFGISPRQYRKLQTVKTKKE